MSKTCVSCGKKALESDFVQQIGTYVHRGRCTDLEMEKRSEEEASVFRERRRLALAVQCPRCGAMPLQKCQSNSRKVVQTHKARLEKVTEDQA